VKYLTIGGIAAILHGVPRATFDLDILIDATPGNAKALLEALQEAGLGTASLTDVQTLLANEITVFKDRIRIDVQTRTPGLVFQDAWGRREVLTYEGQAFFIVSKGDLIRSKKAAGREIDIADVRLLETEEIRDE
jgi:hypothetical protein